MRVVLVNNVVAPYRHELFHALGQELAQFEVWYCRVKTRDKIWAVDDGHEYRWEVLGTREGRFFRRSVLIPGRETFRAVMQRDWENTVLIVGTGRQSSIHSLVTARLAHARGAKVVAWVGNVPEQFLTRRIPAIIDSLYERVWRSILNIADGALFYSGLSAAWAKERRLPQRPAFIGTQAIGGPSGISPRVEPNRGDVFRCAYVGALDERKGVDLLIRALLMLPSSEGRRLRLEVIGHGPLRVLEQEIRQRTPSVCFRGFVPRDELWKIYRDCDFIIVPSRADPWAFVTNEAMLMGTPVLCSTAAGSHELVQNCGWQVPPGDPVALRDGLREAMRECRDISRRRLAHAHAIELSPTAVASGISRFLRTLMK